MKTFNELDFYNNFEEVRKFYDNEGYIIIDNFLDNKTIDDINNSIVFDKNRFQDIWKENENVRKVAGNKKMIAILKKLYDDNPLPFQTLNFKKGTQQYEHVDLMHFCPSTDNLNLMCGVWYAFEDITPEKGPLIFYPKSHKEKFIIDLSNIGSYQDYEKYMRTFSLLNYERTSALLSKGSVIIWASNLIHGGHSYCEPDKTRLSMVTHYFFESSKYWWTPVFSKDEKLYRNNIKEISSKILE